MIHSWMKLKYGASGVQALEGMVVAVGGGERVRRERMRVRVILVYIHN
jgi:hypothetical protein